jgi:hypothetical protein
MHPQKRSEGEQQGSTQLWFEAMVGKAPVFINNNVLYAVWGLNARQERLPLDRVENKPPNKYAVKPPSLIQYLSGYSKEGRVTP